MQTTWQAVVWNKKKQEKFGSLKNNTYICNVQTKRTTDIMSEKETIAMLRQSSQWAFETIFNKYSGELYIYCLQFTKSREKANLLAKQDILRHSAGKGSLWGSRSAFLVVQFKFPQGEKHLYYILKKKKLKKNTNTIVYFSPKLVL